MTKTIQTFVFLLLFMQLPIQTTSAQIPVEGKDNFRYLEMDITRLQQEYKDGKITIREVVQSYKDRIDDIDKNGPALHSIIRLNPDAIRISEKLDDEFEHSKTINGPLFGIPVVIKDNIDTHDSMPCTGGSRALMNS